MFGNINFGFWIVMYLRKELVKIFKFKVYGSRVFG